MSTSVLQAPTMLSAPPVLPPAPIANSKHNVPKNENERKALNVHDNLTCHICLEKFSTVGDKKPMFTSCGHTYCQGCLEKGKMRKCPTCRAPFTFPFKPVVNFALCSLIENMSTKSELLPELNYSFSQRWLIEDLARTQDLVRDLKIELKFSERLEVEIEDEKESSELEAKIKALEIKVQEAEEKVFNKRLELSNVISKTPSYLFQAEVNAAKEVTNPFTFTPETFVASSSSSPTACFKNIVESNFNFASSNVSLKVGNTSNPLEALKKRQEEEVKSNKEVTNAIEATNAAMNWKQYESHIQTVIDSSNVVEGSLNVIEGSVAILEEAVNVFGTSDPIVIGQASVRKKAKPRKSRKSGVTTEDVLSKFDRTFVPLTSVGECLSTCKNPFAWIFELF